MATKNSNQIGILGGGYTGLAAAYELSKAGYQVTILEKEAQAGGLAAGFKLEGWDWSLEKAYHHWFTNDDYVLNLSKQIGVKPIIKRPQTNVYVQGKMIPFDSPLALLKFPYLPLIDRLRTGLAALYLKLISDHKTFEGKNAIKWIKKYMGERSFQLIWEPLFIGKFNQYKDQIALTWFWARIKKRTPSLAYPEGGFQNFAQTLAQTTIDSGARIDLGVEVTNISEKKDQIEVKTKNKTYLFDKVIVTLPSPIFTKVTPDLPKKYTDRINSVPHLHAINLILILKKPFLGSTYWLNITQQDFPFLVLAEHTNFMDSKHYNNQHILYIGNYLPSDHKFLKMTKEELLKTFDPYLKKINPDYKSQVISSHLFFAPFAQPVVTVEYPKLISDFETPIKNLYVANMDMVYPWDRGTNYAIEMGQRIAKLIQDAKI